MNYHKLISDAAVKLNSLVNEIIDTLDKEGTPVNPGTIISDLTARAFPEKDNVTVVDQLEAADDKEIRKMQEQAPEIFGKPEDDDHFGEEQAEGLGNLLEGLKDTPHDDRW